MKTTQKTHEWLMAKNRGGRSRLQVLGWRKLAALYYAAEAGSPVRKVIDKECRRCGYAPRTILALNA
ncbi:MAG: hypothetical protein ABFD92_00120 [Planctomycetaceae bacterium]|nr:hypothetical protein [Planctomycetaceae bacterium]